MENLRTEEFFFVDRLMDLASDPFLRCPVVGFDGDLDAVPVERHDSAAWVGGQEKGDGVGAAALGAGISPGARGPELDYFPCSSFVFVGFDFLAGYARVGNYLVGRHV